VILHVIKIKVENINVRNTVGKNMKMLPSLDVFKSAELRLSRGKHPAFAQGVASVIGSLTLNIGDSHIHSLHYNFCKFKTGPFF
jgi:hypothetical protein